MKILKTGEMKALLEKTENRSHTENKLEETFKMENNKILKAPEIIRHMKRILICIIDSPEEENWANQTFKNSNRILPEKKKKTIKKWVLIKRTLWASKQWNQVMYT